MKEGFEVLEHISEAKIKVWALDLPGLFRQSALGMYHIMTAGALPETVNGQEREIEVSASDSEGLLVQFLSDLLYQTEINDEVYTKFKFYQFRDDRLRAKISGTKIDKIETDIKGVTFYDLEIKKKDSGYEVELVFDI